MDQFGKSSKVVIVEDNANLAEIYRLRLELLGYSCFTAYDGLEALSLIEHELPDLVLLDLMVPKVAGDQILATMRASDWGKNIKVLVISNLNEADAPAGLREQGIDGYAVKANLSNDQLDQLVDNILKPAYQEENIDLETQALEVVHSPHSEAGLQDVPKDLIVTRVFAASATAVWRAWSDGDVLQQWWGPDNFSCPSATMNVYPGGLSVVAMQASAACGGHLSYGGWAYTDVIPDQKLAFIHNLTNAAGQKIDPASIAMPTDFPQGQRHEITFKSLSATQTQLTVVEHNWPTVAMLEMSKVGLEQSLTKLAAVLAAATD